MSDEQATSPTFLASGNSRLPTEAENETPGESPVDDDTNAREEPDTGDLTHEENELAPESANEEADSEPGCDDEPQVSELTGDDASDSQLQDIEAVRELIHSLHLSIVPELISGDSVSALIASINPAEEAYNRIVTGMNIPAGGNSAVTFESDSLPTFDKIRRGLSAHVQKGK